MRLLPKSLRREYRQSGLAEPTQDLIASLGGELVVSGERVSTEGALRVADVFAAVTIIAETIGTLPLRVYQRRGDLVDELPEHRAARMLGMSPNPVMPAHRFWSMVAGHLLLWGNAYIEKLRDEDGLVAELWPIHPQYVTVEWNESLRRKRFVIDYGGTREVLSDDRVLHMLAFTTDGFMGLSPIMQARQQIGLAKARERFEGEVYAQKPFLTGVVTHPGQIKDTVKLRESWAAIYGGGDRGVRGGQSARHGVAVLEEGATYAPLTAPLEDMQFVEQQQMSKRNIAALFHLPPAYLGGSTGDSLTYQTVESNAIQFAKTAVTPVTTNIQKFLSFDTGIFPFVNYYAEFTLEALLRGDSVARAAFYKTMSEIKAITSDEIRRLENFPPLTQSEKDELSPSVPAALMPTLDGQDGNSVPD